MALQRFDPNPMCIKCESIDVHVAFHGAESSECTRWRHECPSCGVEHLRHTCRCCGYSWLTATADSGKE